MHWIFFGFCLSASRTQRWNVPGVTIVINWLMAGPRGRPYFSSRARSAGVVTIRSGSRARRDRFSCNKYWTQRASARSVACDNI